MDKKYPRPTRPRSDPCLVIWASTCGMGVCLLLMDDQYAKARIAVDACPFRARNLAEGYAMIGTSCPGCGYLIANVFSGDPDSPPSLGHDMRQYMGGVT